MPDESPSQISEEIQRLLQQSILDNYPNPERRGCPGNAVLLDVARRTFPIHDTYWEHATHCSPCFAEFLTFRRELANSRKRLVWRNRVVLGSVLAAAAIGVLIWRGVRAPAPTVTDAEFNVDMRPFSVSRGESSSRPPATQYCGILTTNRGRLNVILPVGAPEGQYEVRLMDNDLRSVSASGTAAATLNDHLNRLSVTFDLTRIQPGNYFLLSRPANGVGWMSCPVLVR